MCRSHEEIDAEEFNDDHEYKSKLNEVLFVFRFSFLRMISEFNVVYL